MEKQTSSINKDETKEIQQEFALETIITNAIKIPGVKVDRKKFLAERFANEVDDLQNLIDIGPVAAGFSEEKLKRMSNKLILERTTYSSLASFAMGIPGVLSTAISVPADVLQFYGMTLRLVQELAYLYGADDIWKDGKVDEEMVRNQLILYCGVMFGVAGAAKAVRVLSTQIAKTIAKKLPQQALTKTFWYPIIKKIGTSIGVKVTKKALTNGLTTVVPVIGGVVSGVMTFASMKPMAEKLQKTLEDSTFHYSEEEFENDIKFVDSIDGKVDVIEVDPEPEKKSLLEKGKEKFNSLFKKKETNKAETQVEKDTIEKSSNNDNFEQVKKLKELLDIGAITQEEYDIKKKELLGL